MNKYFGVSWFFVNIFRNRDSELWCDLVQYVVKYDELQNETMKKTMFTFDIECLFTKRVIIKLLLSAERFCTRFICKYIDTVLCI